MKIPVFSVMMIMTVMVTGCSSNPPIPDPAIAACPEKAISIVQANQRFFAAVIPGMSRASKLSKLDGLRREATLVKAGEAPMTVKFYQTGLPGCPWAMSSESLTPAIVRNKVIMAYGGQTLKDMTAHGWVLQEAIWPWQDYYFGYLPRQ